MSTEQAIILLEKLKEVDDWPMVDVMGTWYYEMKPFFAEALDMAINALNSK